MQGPASIETQAGIVVRHLGLSVNGGSLALDGRLTPGLNFTLNAANLPASLARIVSPDLNITGTLSATAKITGSTASPAGNITLNADAIKLHSGAGAAIPAADLAASAAFAGKSAAIHARLDAGPDANLEADGQVPMRQTGRIDLHLAGMTNLQILDPIVAAQGTAIRGVLTPDFTVTGTPAAPIAYGTLTLAGGSVQNVGSGLNLTKISAQLDAAGKLISLRNFTATAGAGSITGHGNIDLGEPGLPLDFGFDANNATPVSSDLVTENIDAALTLKGAVKSGLALGGKIEILKADINIPKSLPAFGGEADDLPAGGKTAAAPCPAARYRAQSNDPCAESDFHSRRRAVRRIGRTADDWRHRGEPDSGGRIHADPRQFRAGRQEPAIHQWRGEFQWRRLHADARSGGDHHHDRQ